MVGMVVVPTGTPELGVMVVVVVDELVPIMVVFDG